MSKKTPPLALSLVVSLLTPAMAFAQKPERNTVIIDHLKVRIGDVKASHLDATDAESAEYLIKINDSLRWNDQLLAHLLRADETGKQPLLIVVINPRRAADQVGQVQRFCQRHNIALAFWHPVAAKFAEPQVRVNINTATRFELMAYLDVRRELAEAIIRGRPYGQAEQIKDVKGIGDATFKDISNKICVR